jgi:hypothetical protein
MTPEFYGEVDEGYRDGDAPGSGARGYDWRAIEPVVRAPPIPRHVFPDPDPCPVCPAPPAPGPPSP